VLLSRLIKVQPLGGVIVLEPASRA